MRDAPILQWLMGFQYQTRLTFIAGQLKVQDLNVMNTYKDIQLVGMGQLYIQGILEVGQTTVY